MELVRHKNAVSVLRILDMQKMLSNMRLLQNFSFVRATAEK